MGILKKIMKKPAKSALDQLSPTPSVDGVFYEQMFKQSNGFRGSKRFRLTVNGYDPTEQGMQGFLASGGDLEYANIMLRGRQHLGKEFVDVYVNGHLIGSIPDWTINDEQKEFLHEKLFKGKVVGVHLSISDTAYIYLVPEQ